MTTTPTPPHLPEAQDTLMARELLTVPVAGEPLAAIRGRSQWEIFWRRFRSHRLGMIAVAALVLLALAAILVPYLSPYAFDAIPSGSDFSRSILQPPSWSHPFGTNELGQDEFTRVFQAGRISLQVGFITALLAGTAGTVLGMLAGYFGRATDSAIARVTDLFLAAPVFIVLIAISVIVGNPGLYAIILILALFSWMPMTRITRASALSLKEREYVMAARAMGASRARIMFRHILPNSVAEIIVFTTLTVGIAILTESALSFLGLGINVASQVSWGNLLSNQTANVLGGQAWWLTIFPGAAILLTILCVNFVGDALRDALDPYGISLVKE